MTRLFLLGTCACLAGCAVPASGPVAITKVNPYHLSSATVLETEDPMITFEQRRHLRGAIESADYSERYGNYFTVFWTSKTKAPAVVRLEYRQGSTGLKTLVKEVAVDAPKRSNTTKFEITGDDYRENGKVTQWKASIVESGTVVAEYKSYLWQ